MRNELERFKESSSTLQALIAVKVSEELKERLCKIPRKHRAYVCRRAIETYLDYLEQELQFSLEDLDLGTSPEQRLMDLEHNWIEEIVNMNC